MVKQIVELGGGAVGVHSIGADQGSLFSFSMNMERQLPDGIAMMDPLGMMQAAADIENLSGELLEQSGTSLKSNNDEHAVGREDKRKPPTTPA